MLQHKVPPDNYPQDLLMSITPVVGRRIMSSSKKYEYRRSIFRKPVNRVYLYLSSPERKITGYWFYRGYLEGTVREIWEATKDQSAAAKSAYLDYFQNTNKAFAIPVERFIPFDTPVDPWLEAGFLPPQSFRYIAAAARNSALPALW
jgi:type I restriction enzyme S subunit